MFASQLLRILQTIPSDVKYESCVYDSAEQDMTMKENHNVALHDSQSLGREANPFAFESKEIYIRDTDERWNPKFVDEFSMDNQNATRDFTENEFQNGPSRRPSSLVEDADSLSSERNSKDNAQSCPEHECQNEYVDSLSPCIAALDLFETDTKSYADKNVFEYKLPEIVVCYKEINYHVVKDICIDEGMPLNDKSLIESSKDEQSGHTFPQPLDDSDTELFLSDGLATSSLDSAKGVCANENDSKEESHGKLVNQEMSKLPSEISIDKDDAEPCDPVHIKCEANFGEIGKTLSDATEEDSFIDRTLPIQEFGTRSFLRSFLNSLDDSEDNQAAEPQDQEISSGKAVSSSPTASSEESGPNKDMQASSLYFNSKVENGSITFNFNSPPPVVPGTTNERTETIEEQPIDMLDHNKEANANNLSDSKQVHSNSINDTIIEQQVHEQSLNIKNPFSNDFPATSQPQFISDEKGHDQSPDWKDKKSNDVLSVNDSVVSQGARYDEGETSFSAAGLITYSGPIAYSGSLSLRSDGSATSGRSFAFPILQSEWNSSPVRMTKAERRHFRKHKGWRSGLLCCRF